MGLNPLAGPPPNYYIRKVMGWPTLTWNIRGSCYRARFIHTHKPPSNLWRISLTSATHKFRILWYDGAALHQSLLPFSHSLSYRPSHIFSAGASFGLAKPTHAGGLGVWRRTASWKGVPGITPSDAHGTRLAHRHAYPPTIPCSNQMGLIHGSHALDTHIHVAPFEMQIYKNCVKLQVSAILGLSCPH